MIKVKKPRILSLSLRPKNLDELIGQPNLVSSIKNQFESERIPHFFIISGPTGSGKTTLARIIANTLKTTDIKEVNAANTNGIDDIRSIIESMKYHSVYSKCKVVIMDEAHQITKPAQNALLTETEDVSDHVYYIFCTTDIGKIVPALKRRAFVLNLGPLDKNGVTELVRHAANVDGYTENIDSIVNDIILNDLTTPGLVLQACERIFCGLPMVDVQNPEVNNLEICRAVASLNWRNICTQCKHVTNSDVIGVKLSICGYLKTILVNNPTLKIAKIIDNLSKCNNDVPSFLAAIYLGIF